MVDLEFERRLERDFALAASFPDDVAFCRSVDARLNQDWVLRRWLIGAAGVTGGVIGASQLLMNNFIHRVEALSQGSSKVLEAGFSQLRPGVTLLGLVSSDVLVAWVAAGLAVVAIGFVLTRVIEEI